MVWLLLEREKIAELELNSTDKKKGEEEKTKTQYNELNTFVRMRLYSATYSTKKASQNKQKCPTKNQTQKPNPKPTIKRNQPTNTKVGKLCSHSLESSSTVVK